MSKAIILIFGLSLLGGCATRPQQREAKIVPEDQVVIVDPTAEERKLHGHLLDAEPTPDIVKVGQKDGIKIRVIKGDPIYDSQVREDLQVWDVIGTNSTDIPQCVTMMWNLMEFEYISDGPSEQLVMPHEFHHFGQMRQKGFKLGDVIIAPSPSGYMKDMRVRAANMNNEPGDECLFITPEEDIIEAPETDESTIIEK